MKSAVKMIHDYYLPSHHNGCVTPALLGIYIRSMMPQICPHTRDVIIAGFATRRKTISVLVIPDYLLSGAGMYCTCGLGLAIRSL